MERIKCAIVALWNHELIDMSNNAAKFYIESLTCFVHVNTAA